MKIDLTVLNSKKETVLQSSKDDLFFVAISTYWEYARGTDECKTLVKNLKTERKEYQDRYDELELSAQKSLNKALGVIKKELKGTESEHPDIWIQIKKFEDFKRGYDDQDRRIQPLEDLAQKYRRIIGQILHDLYKIPKYTNLGLKYIRVDQDLPQVILDSFDDSTYHEYIQYQTIFKDGLSYRLCFEIDRITYISQAINDTPNREIELKKKLENVSVFDDKFQAELMELQALQEWRMVRKGEKKTHEGYTFDFNVFDREKTRQTLMSLHENILEIIAQNNNKKKILGKQFDITDFKWENLELAFDEGLQELKVSYKKKYLGTFDFVQLGFSATIKNHKIDQRWNLLTRLSVYSTVKGQSANPKELARSMETTVGNIHRIKSDLSSKLQGLFKTDTSPFVDRKDLYQPIFKLLSSPSLRHEELWQQGSPLRENGSYDQE